MNVRLDYSAGTKACSKCREVKPLSAFVHRPGKFGPRPEPQCRTCGNARFREWSKRTRRGADSVPTPPRGFIPPADFLPMGEPDRDTPLRWAI